MLIHTWMFNSIVNGRSYKVYLSYICMTASGEHSALGIAICINATLTEYSVLLSGLSHFYCNVSCRYAKCYYSGCRAAYISSIFICCPGQSFSLQQQIQPQTHFPFGINQVCWVLVCQIFEIVKLISCLIQYLAGNLAPSGQTVGSLLIPPGRQSRLGKCSEHSSNR